MFIIIDGPDGAGKSTLAAELADATGYPLISFDKPKNKEEQDNMFMMYVDTINKYDNVIFDRSWYSEMVYGPLFRHRSAISQHQMFCLEELVVMRGGGMIIHCTDKAESLVGRAMSRGESFVPPHMFADIKKAYDHVMHKVHHTIPVVIYNVPTV